MDNQHEISPTPQKLSFIEFWRRYYPQYVIDDDNLEVINAISLYAAGDKSFEDEKKGLYLEKAIFIKGTVGTGKSDLFSIFSVYLGKYLRSPQAFQSHITWKVASEFSGEGYAIFDHHETGNRFYDELCLTNARTKFPERELVSHYGNKLLIGEEIILYRYECFKRFGLKSHFASNEEEDDIEKIYGKRAYSRLKEMCNFFTLFGRDRRDNTSPKFRSGLYSPVPVSRKELSAQEIAENKQFLDEKYQKFLETGSIDAYASMYYPMLRVHGCDLGDEQAMEQYLTVAGSQYVQTLEVQISGPAAKEADRRDKVERMAKGMAVYVFFTRLKEGGRKSIFGQIEVSISEIVNDLVKENKDQQ